MVRARERSRKPVRSRPSCQAGAARNSLQRSNSDRHRSGGSPITENAWSHGGSLSTEAIWEGYAKSAPSIFHPMVTSKTLGAQYNDTRILRHIFMKTCDPGHRFSVDRGQITIKGEQQHISRSEIDLQWKKARQAYRQPLLYQGLIRILIHIMFWM